MGAVTLREERQSITIDSPEIVAELCSEMRFLDRELLRVVLLNARQHLIKVVTVSQGTVNESLAHPREIFKPVEAIGYWLFAQRALESISLKETYEPHYHEGGCMGR
jgi:DNA repair protein RadC